MPTPLEILLDPLSLTVIGMYVVLYAWESLFPRHRNLPKIKGATIRGLSAFVVFFYLSSYLPLLTDEFLATYQVVNLKGWPIIIQVITGLMVYQFLLYFWHRSLHRSNLLWRVFHQMHHSSEKLDIPSTFYFSPMDMIGFTILGSLAFAFILGVEPAAATVIILSLNFLSMFQHANIKTPAWVGYIIQRPEQHSVHHARGVHRYNYSDFPVFDFLFGTFRNPDDYQGEYGFYNNGSGKVKEMLTFGDINKS